MEQVIRLHEDVGGAAPLKLYHSRADPAEGGRHVLGEGPPLKT